MISIIVPCYNVEKYLDRCLDSIVAQTNQNYEVIMVNDGSKDGSGDICNRYADKYERFQAYHKTNGGLADARNYGLKYVNGDYVTFLDSDDWITSDYVASLEEYIKQYPAIDHIRFGYYIDYSENDYTIDKVYPNEKIAKKQSEVADTIRTAEKQGMFNSVCGGCYRYSIIKENSLAFIKHSEPGEDLLFNCEFFKKVYSCAVSTKQIYHYMRQGEMTMTKKYDAKLYEKIQDFDQARIDLYSALEMNSESDRESILEYYHGYVMSCIYNLYGSGDRSVDRKAFLHTILEDKRHQQAMAVRDKLGGNLGVYDKIFSKLYIKGNVSAMDRTYRKLFYMRNNFKGIYNDFRKRIFQKEK